MKDQNTALTKVEPSPAEILRAVVEKGVTTENVAAVKEIVMLMERIDIKNSEKQFVKEFNNLQSDLPVIVAKSTIPNRGKYERFEDIMHVVQPLLTKHGFTVSFSMEFKDNRILQTCHLKHIGGHTQSNSFAVRSGKADTDTQADCKAATTAKRNAFLNALNIVIRQDCLNEEEDAGILGDPNAFITAAQVEEIRHRVAMCQADEKAFLKYANAPTYQQIPANKYDELDSMLSRKERAGR